MTPTEQTHRKAAIMFKFGGPGRIEFKHQGEPNEWVESKTPAWNWRDFVYRWIGPGKRVELKRGMEVRTLNGLNRLVTSDQAGTTVTIHGHSGAPCQPVDIFTHYRWPNNPDQTWLPVVQEEVLEV